MDHIPTTFVAFNLYRFYIDKSLFTSNQLYTTNDSLQKSSDAYTFLNIILPYMLFPLSRSFYNRYLSTINGQWPYSIPVQVAFHFMFISILCNYQFYIAIYFHRKFFGHFLLRPSKVIAKMRNDSMRY